MLSVVVVLGAGLPCLAAANTADCYLKELRDVQNDFAAHQAAMLCLSRHGPMEEVPAAGKIRRLVGYDNWRECAAREGGRTGSKKAAQMIAYACRQLYGEAE